MMRHSFLNTFCTEEVKAGARAGATVGAATALAVACPLALFAVTPLNALITIAVLEIEGVFYGGLTGALVAQVNVVVNALVHDEIDEETAAVSRRICR